MPETTPPTDTPKEAPDLDAALDKHLGADQPPSDVAPAPPAPTWRDAVLDGDDVPENFRGKKAGDLFQSWQHSQQAIAKFTGEKGDLVSRLNQANVQLTARQAAEQSIREMLRPPPAAEQEDPRYAQLNDLIFTDPEQYNRLRQQLDDERHEKRIAAERVRIKSELTQESNTLRNQEVGRWAFNEARNSLHGRGISDDMFTPQRIAALYSAITLRSTPEMPNEYYDAGGPQSPAVIFKAWGDLFGYPAAPAAAAAPPPPPPPASTPPGGGRPSSAAVPPPRREDGRPMSNELRAVMESFAEEAGKPKDHLIKKVRGAA